MRERLIIKLDGTAIGKPVTLTDTEFKRIRTFLLARGYPMDADTDWSHLPLLSSGLTENQLKTFPERIREILSDIRKKKHQNDTRRRYKFS